MFLINDPALIALLAIVGFVFGVGFIIFKRTRRRGQALAIVSVVVGGVAFWQVAVISDDRAKRIGWDSASDQHKAQDAGFTNPAEWKKVKADRLAKEAAEKAANASKAKAAEEQDRKRAETQMAAEKAAKTEQEKKRPAAGTEKPPDQLKFERLVAKWRDAYVSGNDFGKLQMRERRAAELCVELSTGEVRDWQGTVREVHPISNGDAYLWVGVTELLSFWTKSGNEVPRQSKPYSVASRLKEGDAVRFSGMVLKDKKYDHDCFDETSLTESGSMEEPAFSFWFTGLAVGADSAIPDDDLSSQADRDAECAKDLTCWAVKNIGDAVDACIPEIEKRAQSDLEWQSGLLTLTFSRYGWANIADKTLTYSGDRIKLQNGFGAWQTFTYFCTYDPTRQVVLDVHLMEGKL